MNRQILNDCIICGKKCKPGRVYCNLMCKNKDAKRQKEIRLEQIKKANLLLEAEYLSKPLDQQLNDFKNSRSKLTSGFARNYLEQYKGLKSQLLAKYGDLPSLELLYLYFYKYGERPTCLNCGKDVRFLGFIEGYRIYCNVNCQKEDKAKNASLNKIKKIENKKNRQINQKNITQKEKQKLLQKQESLRLKRVLYFKNKANEDINFEIDKYIRDLLNNNNNNNNNNNSEDIISRNHCFGLSKTNNFLSFTANACGKRKEAEIKTDGFIFTINFYLEKFKLAISGNNLFENSFGKDPNNIIYNNFEEESLFKFQSYNKTNLLTNNGINLLNINQNEWLDPVKQDIWKSIISTKLGKNKRYFAKNTYVEEIKDNKIKNSFLNQNHLQGEDGSSIKLGLYLKDTNELLSLMTFGKNRYTQGVNYELIRFCNKKYTTIVGAASKLFKYFRTHYLNESQGIVSYADRRHSVGNLYQKLGFTYSHISKPNYKYFHKDDISTLYSRVSFQKHKLESKLDIFENDLSETMNMFNNGYRKIYDSGNFVYLLYK